MKRFDPGTAKMLAGPPGSVGIRFRRLWRSGAVLRATSTRRISLVDSCMEGSRSCPTIQEVFCGPEMWRAHDEAVYPRRRTRARGTPERSLLEESTVSPAAV